MPRARFTGGRELPAHLDRDHLENRERRYVPKLDFSAELRVQLRKYYPIEAIVDPVFGDPADEFVELVLNEAHWAISWAAKMPFRLTRAELRAEHRALLGALRRARCQHRLRGRRRLSALVKARERLDRSSPETIGLLGADAEAWRCVPLLSEAITAYETSQRYDFTACDAALGNMISYLEAASRKLVALPANRKPAARRNLLAKEMALRVLRVLYSHYDIKPFATAPEYASRAVQILKLIGDDIGLKFAAKTWRNVIAAVKPEVLKLSTKQPRRP